MTEELSGVPEGLSERDIVFDCPACGKSLAIDEEGAGLVVVCPKCGTRMRVPIPERLRAEAASPGLTSTADYTTAVESSAPETETLRERVGRLEVTMDEVQKRKRHLEKFRIDCMIRMERLHDEMGLIQAALDRMTDVLQDIPKV
jgi:DNA-directed RNA polymerase subunit RPC12/RpoP